jgi:carbamoyltransferase
MDVARSIQSVTEEVMLRLARHARDVTGQRDLCLAGGVALNCVANGRILKEKMFDRIWVQPASGDAGGALGAALAVSRRLRPDASSPPCSMDGTDAMQGALLGPSFTDHEIEQTLRSCGAVYQAWDTQPLLRQTAELLAREKVVGWFQGRMEFGPRALGNRSILADPRSSRMQSMLNLKVKFRESFRPFAPAVRKERQSDYFDLESDSPYMLLTASVRAGLCSSESRHIQCEGFERLQQVRSTIPAVTHVDLSARIQTVAEDPNPLFYALLQEFEKLTRCGVLVNTSFNVRDEPIVCSPADAYRCFVKTEMDYLVMGSYLLERSAQPAEGARSQPE